MHWESYYIHPEDVREDEVVFRGEEAGHLSRVVRRKPGERVWAVDGEGTAYEVELSIVEKETVRGKILQRRRLLGEPVADVALAQGVLKGERFDLLVEKATEIGVRRIIPLITKTSLETVGTQKIARWNRIALAAMKQSGRSILPEVTPPCSLRQVLKMGPGYQHRFIAHTGQESQPFAVTRDLSGAIPRALLIVGPEGGFAEEEVGQASEQGFRTVTLGPRRLRAETAGIVLVTLFLFQTGELE